MAENTTSNFTSSGMFYFDVPLWAEVITTLFLSVVTLIGVIGNGMIFVVQLCNSEKSSTDILVFTMAIFEFLCAGFNSVIAIIRNISSLWKPIATVTVCCIHVFTLYSTSIACTLLLAAIAFDRYIHTCRPFSRFYTKAKAMWTSITIAVISIVTSSPMLQFTTLNKQNLNCEMKKEQETAEQLIQFTSAGAFILMFFAVVFCYTKVSLLLRRRHRRKLKIACAVASTSNRAAHGASHVSITSSYERNGKRSNLTRNAVHPTDIEERVLNEAILDETQSNERKSEVHSAGYIPQGSTPPETVKKTNNLKPGLTFADARSSSVSKIELLGNGTTENETPRDKSIVPIQSYSDKTDGFMSKIKRKSEIMPEKEGSACDNTPGNLQLRQEQKLVNRTTVIMFLISLIYILSWVIFWLTTGLFSSSTPTGNTILYLFKYVYAVNCMTNPIFFMLLSSRFRQKAKELLRRLC